MFVTGCSVFGSVQPKPAPYQPPELDPRDKKACYDPGIEGDALSALGDTRVALADCRKKHENVVDQYEAVRVKQGTQAQ